MFGLLILVPSWPGFSPHLRAFAHTKPCAFTCFASLFSEPHMCPMCTLCTLRQLFDLGGESEEAILKTFTNNIEIGEAETDC
jgi:hypothetical protein